VRLSRRLVVGTISVVAFLALWQFVGQREIVRSVLARTAFVVSFGDAPPEAGGWGATIATLL